jgi:hypothetical protein
MALGFINLHRPTPAAQEPQRGQTRAFVGDGGPLLVVPGLKELLGVRIGLMNLPLNFQRRFPLDNECKEQVNVPWPLVMLDNLPDETPVLLRNECCNNGVWQVDEKVYITGEWADDVPAPEEPVIEKPRPKRGIG